MLRLILPKMNKEQVDLRLESFPIPTGPTTRAILSWLDALGILTPGASPEAIVFPDIDPRLDTVRGPFLTVERASELLRKHVFIPAGIPGGSDLTLRGIRSSASTDAAAAGVDTTSRLAQGGSSFYRVQRLPWIAVSQPSHSQ